MKNFISPPLKVAALTASLLFPLAGHAGCYAEYKAKRENPLKLHFGVSEILDSPCTVETAEAGLTSRLENDGWILLTIVAMIDETELEAVKTRAGAFYLKY